MAKDQMVKGLNLAADAVIPRDLCGMYLRKDETYAI